MKQAIILAVLFFISHLSDAQPIKKITINELEAYIHSSNHPLIVNFWATSCGPCVREIAYSQTIVEKYKNNDIELLLVSLDIPKFYPETISAFAKKKNITATIFWLNENNPTYYYTKIDKRWTGDIPATLLVNNKTKYYTFFDRQLTAPQFEEAVNKLIKE